MTLHYITLYGIIILNSRLNVIILAIANNYNPHPSPLLTLPFGATWKGKVASPLPPPSCLPLPLGRGGVGNLEGKGCCYPSPSSPKGCCLSPLQVACPKGGVGNLEGKATFPNPKQLSPSKLPRRGG